VCRKKEDARGVCVFRNYPFRGERQVFLGEILRKLEQGILEEEDVCLLVKRDVLVATDADEAFDDSLKLHFRADSGLAFFEELLIDIKESDALHGWDVRQRSRGKRRRPDLGTFRIKLYEVAMDVFKAFELSLTLALRFQ
jgi:hypothetical protein